MEKKIHDEIQKIFIDAVLKAQKEVEKKYGVKTRIDLDWEAVEKTQISDDVYMAM